MGVVIDYEHVRFAGPVLWNFLFELYTEFFHRSSVCESLKVGTILPLFKGKGVKANNKDNCRGITLFPTLCNIYEHVRFAGLVLENFLFELYTEFFDRSSVCESLKVGTILPLFKGKGVKANNKDNYRGITLFPTLCKIYEMVLLNRLE